VKTQDTEKIAGTIAKLLQAESQGSDLAAVFAAIEKVNNRLDKLEAAAVSMPPTFPDPLYSHPSLDKLNIAEAIADSIFDGRYKEKACQFEPDKPCDHCSMCSSRGF
jgi:hypothetical protein